MKDANVAELKLDGDIKRHLTLVTLGDPMPAMEKVIDAAREIASTTFE